ncbi:DinB family protein [Alicyclobacillus acidiphilus]|uniref:DinB family protein n=1 Tax=Alicyclobacillus acidiphilus TaxID=182455 RepID=UPI0009FB1367|nr:DinB family protein [Alicyclobacillus acidiphilus]
MASKFFNDDEYERLPQQLADAVQGLSRQQLQRRPAPGKWSILEIVSHIEDHVIAQAFRIRKMVSEEAAQLPSVDQDAWVTHLNANERDPEEMLQTIRAVNRSNATLLSRLGPDDWETTALNPKGETVRLTSVVQGFVAHILHHVDQIQQLAKSSEVR